MVSEVVLNSINSVGVLYFYWRVFILTDIQKLSGSAKLLSSSIVPVRVIMSSSTTITKILQNPSTPKKKASKPVDLVSALTSLIHIF
jgi:hypothetical protein